MQLLRLRPAFDNCEVIFATVRKGYRADVGDARFYVIPDANRWHKGRLVRCALGMFWLVARVRPDVVVTTGAAPGYFAVLFGKWLGAKVVWVDSVANVEELSMAGEKAGAFVDLWLTQWPQLAAEDGPYYVGSVL